MLSDLLSEQCRRTFWQKDGQNGRKQQMKERWEGTAGQNKLVVTTFLWTTRRTDPNMTLCFCASLSSIPFTSHSLPQYLLSTCHMNLVWCGHFISSFFPIHYPFFYFFEGETNRNRETQMAPTFTSAASYHHRGPPDRQQAEIKCQTHNCTQFDRCQSRAVNKINLILDTTRTRFRRIHSAFCVSFNSNFRIKCHFGCVL